MEKAFNYLIKAQRDDGTWLPLWFGNQNALDDENLLYGTARVLLCAEISPLDGALSQEWDVATSNATDWLRSAQNSDGGFGGAPGLPSTIEETAVAVEALVGRALILMVVVVPTLSHGDQGQKE